MTFDLTVACEIVTESHWPTELSSIESSQKLAERILAVHCRLDNLCNVFSFRVVWTDEQNIRHLNFNTRGLDKPTDVLSFPLLPFAVGPGSAELRATSDCLQKGNSQGLDLRSWPDFWVVDRPPILPNQQLELGEIVICHEICQSQALEIGHSLFFEFWRLLIHGLLHLFGFDHESSSQDQVAMEAREDQLFAIVAQAGL